MANEYDDLMKAAQQKLEFQKRNEDNDKVQEQEDIYASIREEADNIDSSMPELDPNYSKEKPDVNLNLPDKDDIDDIYIDPNDTPVFENGPGVSKIQLWKKQYGITRVFHTKILERHFLFRTLNRSEYEQIASLSLDSLTNEELICKTCVLWPLNYDYAEMGKDDAGYPSTLAQIIMENSGFTNEYGIEVL